MLSRLTRPAAATAVALCALAALAACGGDSSDTKTASGFDAVSVSGDFGKEPQIDWKAMLKPGETQSEVVDEGDGPVLQKGDKVLTNFAVSTDVGQDISYETYDKMGVLVDVGSTAQPKQIVDLMTGLINKHIEPGTTRVGTRIAMAVNATKEFGDLALNLSSFGIGNEDGFVLVADLEAVPLDGPKGSAKAAPSWAPKITEKKGEPASLDSSAQPQPDPTSKQLAKAVLIQGTGPVVQKGDQIVANYIGQVYKGKAPFDSSYTRPDPAVFSIGTGNVVKGWDQGLVGAKVGSRVLLRVPPALGYGKKGNGDTIPANSTLYFVVDILAAG